MQFSYLSLCKILLLFLLQIQNGFTQMGKECVIDNDCTIMQWCSAGYCRCQPKLIKVDKLCFAVKNWGEECLFTEQCADHRLICEEDTPNGMKKCVCDRFHHWDNISLTCVQQLNITQVLNMLIERDIEGPIERESEMLFIGAMVAGLVVIVIGSICALIVIGYCYHLKQSDKKARKDLNELISAREKRETLLRVKASQSSQAAPSEIRIQV